MEHPVYNDMNLLFKLFVKHKNWAWAWDDRNFLIILVIMAGFNMMAGIFPVRGVTLGVATFFIVLL